MEYKLGKIENVNFGIEDGRFGIHYVFSGPFGGVTWAETYWDYSVPVNKYTQWTEGERIARVVEVNQRVSSLLNDAKVKYVNQLKGKPVEICFNGNMMTSFRILTEVL